MAGRNEKAHRVAWVLSRRRDLPPRAHVCHACDNPGCVNPNHLFLGSHADNMADKARKGRVRGPRGEAHHKSKISKRQVVEMRTLYATGRYSLQQLGATFGVDKSNVGHVINGRIWKNVGGPIKGKDY